MSRPGHPNPVNLINTHTHVMAGFPLGRGGLTRFSERGHARWGHQDGPLFSADGSSFLFSFPSLPAEGSPLWGERPTRDPLARWVPPTGPVGPMGPAGFMGSTGPMAMGTMDPMGLGPLGPTALWAPWAHGPQGPMRPMGPIGPMGHMGPMGPMSPMGPGPMGSVGAIDP